MILIIWDKIRDKLKLFIFDLDGTLIDTSDRFYNVFMFLAEKYGLPKVSRDEFRLLYKSNQLGGLILQVKQRFLPEFLRIYHEFKGDSEQPFEGVREALKLLKDRNYILSVVTGRIIEAELVRQELQLHGLADLLDEVLANNFSEESSSGDEALQKVYEFKNLLGKYGVKPVECVVVGDYVLDIVSGKKLGCWTIGVLTGGLDYSILKQAEPDAILPSVRDIPRLLKII
ncbi:MAG: HAD family hydrolase [Candidatus Odinarchaeota archaeon]